MMRLPVPWQLHPIVVCYLYTSVLFEQVSTLPPNTHTSEPALGFPNLPCSTSGPTGESTADYLKKFNVTSEEQLLGFLTQIWLKNGQTNQRRGLFHGSFQGKTRLREMEDVRRQVVKCFSEHLNVTQLIEAQGYPVEHHEVHTEDGFILGIQRIPYGREGKPKASSCRRPVVILQHGLFGSASNFVSNLANESLAFVLADAGYDVWLGNSRGNTYSRRHEWLRPHQKEFWYWSWDEMGKYDLPALVEYALEWTNQEKVFYVGHSQGTTQAFAELSKEDSPLTDKIRLFVALAPVAKVAHISGMFKSITTNSLCCFAKDVLALFHQYEFLRNSFLINTLAADTLCANQDTVEICVFFLEHFGGVTESNLNYTRIRDYLWNSPAGTSIYDVEHYCQMVLSDKFQMYNYGPRENLRRYGQLIPPMYHPKNIAVPVAFFSGGHDRLADVEDVKWIRGQLGSNLIFDKFIPTYGHIDFILGLDAVERIYGDIVELFHKFS